MHSGVIHVSKHRCVSAHVNGTNSHFEALALKFELSTMMTMFVTISAGDPLETNGDSLETIGLRIL